MSKMNQVSSYVVCMIALLTVLGCGKKETPKGRVFFSEPKDGVVINGEVKVVMGVEGNEIKPAGEIVEGTGHHHILINKDFMAPGQVVPTDDNHRHFGKGQTEAVLDLPSGNYKLTLQFADGLHRSYGKDLSATINIKVTRTIKVTRSLEPDPKLIEGAKIKVTRPLDQESKLIEGAKKEGKMVYWATMTMPQSRQVVEAFHKKYPFIEPELYRTGGDALVNKILTEHRAGRNAWDVTVARGDLFSQLQKFKLIGQYHTSEAKFIKPGLVDKNGYWTGYYANPYALGYNTTMVKKEDVPKTYEELLDPKWSGGKISIDNTAYTFLYGLILAWGEEKAVSFFKRLAAQEPAIMRGNTNRVNLVMAGEFPLIIAYAPTIQRYTSKGAPINWVTLEPVPVQINAVMLSAHAPNPNAAKLFINFMLSKQGQQQLVGFQRIPTRQGIDPNPVRLFKGYKRVIEKPHEISEKDFSRAVKHYQTILKIR